MIGGKYINILVGVILLSIISYAESYSSEFNTEKVASSVIEGFNNNTFVKVIVTLNEKGLDKHQIDSYNSLNYWFPHKSKLYQEQEAKVISTISKNDLKTVYNYSIINGFSGYVTKDGIKNLQNNPYLDFIYPVQKVYANLDQSLPLIHSNYSSNLNYTGKGQTICIIDTGVNYTLPELGGCYDPVFKTCKVVDGYNYIDLNIYPMDDHGHGSHVASIAAANGTIVGVAPEARLLVYKVLDENKGGDSDDVVYAVQQCINNKLTYNVSTIILSLRTNTTDLFDSSTCDPNRPIVQAVNSAYDNGIFVSASSGNKGSTSGISEPACARGATSVAAVYDANVGSREFCIDTFDWWLIHICTETCTDSTTTADKITCYSNRYSDLDLLAPGTFINATRYSSTECSPGCSCTGGYMSCSGTSMAAPHVGGAAAVLRQINNNLSAELIEYVLEESGKLIYDNGTGYSYPRLNLENANQVIERSEVFEITNDGDGNLSVVEIMSNDTWVEDIYPTEFTIVPNETKRVILTLNDSSLPIGTSIGKIKIYSTDPDETIKEVKITLQKVSEGCVGDCPAGSGDWTVDEYTSIWFDGVDVSGKLNLQDMLFLGEQETNISEELAFTDGELRLDGSVLNFN